VEGAPHSPLLCSVGTRDFRHQHTERKAQRVSLGGCDRPALKLLITTITSHPHGWGGRAGCSCRDCPAVFAVRSASLGSLGTSAQVEGENEELLAKQGQDTVQDPLRTTGQWPAKPEGYGAESRHRELGEGWG
jgi:hypothetical protein